MNKVCPITSEQAISFAQELRGKSDNKLFRKTTHEQPAEFWSNSNKDDPISTPWMQAGLKSYIAFGALSGYSSGNFPVRFKFSDEVELSVDKGVITAWVKHEHLNPVVDASGIVVSFQVQPAAFSKLS